MEIKSNPSGTDMGGRYRIYDWVDGQWRGSGTSGPWDTRGAAIEDVKRQIERHPEDHICIVDRMGNIVYEVSLQIQLNDAQYRIYLLEDHIKRLIREWMEDSRITKECVTEVGAAMGLEGSFTQNYGTVDMIKKYRALEEELRILKESAE